MVLIADKLSDRTVSELESMGLKVRFEPDLTAEDLPEVIKDIEILIVRSTKVSASVIENADSLSLIIRAGAGVNTIDLEAASRKGIHVANCPGKNTDAVAELALGLMIAADRRIVPASIDLRNGEWKKKEYGKAAGLKGKTLGIIGLGAIGKALAVRVKTMGMPVCAWSRSMTPETAEELGIEYCSSPLKAAEKSDVISVHLASAPETKHLIGRDFFGSLKKGAIFINTSRGEVVDTDALKSAIKEKELKAVLDVYENEPSAGDKTFGDTELSSMILAGTPHIGASTDQASEAIADEVLNIIKKYKETGKPLNVVNIRDKSVGITNLVVRHFNRVGVLASVLEELRKEGINIEEMNNTIFKGGEAAICTLKLDKEPASNFVESVRNNKDIIQVVLEKT